MGCVTLRSSCPLVGQTVCLMARLGSPNSNLYFVLSNWVVSNQQKNHRSHWIVDNLELGGEKLSYMVNHAHWLLLLSLPSSLRMASKLPDPHS